jgi:glycosyltransferase involved in cell wall biosynthesis
VHATVLSLMPATQTIVLGILTGCAAVLLAYWGVGMIMLIRTVRALPTARAGLAYALRSSPTESVCVVVPAHNEAENIVTVVESLKRQDYPGMRVVLALDRCTDGTPELARRTIAGDDRFEVVEIDACPPDWTGKVNALCTVARCCPAVKESDVLLFADADTRLDPMCLRATVALLRKRGLDLLSLHCTLTSLTWFERLVQPAASLELVRQYPLLLANRQRNRRPFANGQFMMFRRGAYEAIGGHSGAKDDLLEDIALSRLVERHGLRAGLLLADGLVVCHMYRTWQDFRKGWKRIYTEAANRKAGRLMRNGWRIRLFGTMLPVATFLCLFVSPPLMEGPTPVLARVAYWLAGASLGAWLLVLAAAQHVAGAPVWTAPVHPIGSWMVGRLLIEAGRDLNAGKPTHWRGRTYQRQPR